MCNELFTTKDRAPLTSQLHVGSAKAYKTLQGESLQELQEASGFDYFYCRLEAETLRGAKKLLGAPGIATRSKRTPLAYCFY